MEYIITTVITFIAVYFVFKKIKSKEKCAKCEQSGMCLTKNCDIDINPNDKN